MAKKQITAINYYDPTIPNHGTAWTSGEMKKLKKMIEEGRTITYAAEYLGRTPLACDARLSMIRVAILMESSDNELTLREVKFGREEKK